jgi:hypothetical protein
VTAVAVEHVDQVTAEADELAILAGQIEGDRSDLESDADARIAVIIRFGMSYQSKGCPNNDRRHCRDNAGTCSEVIASHGCLPSCASAWLLAPHSYL